MEVYRTDWEDRQRHLESIIKKEFYNKHDDIKGCEHNVGGFISRNKFNLEEPCKCYNCEYVILVVTEYVQKECVLDRHVLAYNKLLENVESYVDQIGSKSDIDHIVHNNFLSNDDPPHGISNGNKKCEPCATCVAEDCQDIEMETYTISTIMKVRTKILNALPMLKGVLKKVPYDEHSYYYVSSRVGIIERVKSKIHRYVMQRGNSGSYGAISRRDCVRLQDSSHNGEEQFDGVHHLDRYDSYDRYDNDTEQPQHEGEAWPCPERSGTTNNTQPRGGTDNTHAECSTRRRKVAPVKFYEIIITTNQNLISLRSIQLLIEMISLFHNYLMKFVLEKKKNEKINFMQRYELKKTEYTFCDESNYLLFYNLSLGKFKKDKKKKKRGEIGLQEGKQVGVEKCQRGDHNEGRSYTSDNSTSIDCESEGSGLNEEVRTKMGVRTPTRSYADLGSCYDNGDSVYTKRVGDYTQRSDDFVLRDGEDETHGPYYTNRVRDSSGGVVEWGTHDEECRRQGEYYGYEDAGYVHQDGDYVDRIDEADCPPPVQDVQECSSTLGEKQTEEMKSYIKHILSCIVGEGDTYLIIELLFTLHTFQLNYFFNILKKMILSKEVPNEFLVMLTYCGYKIENIEIIEYCFWKLVRIFERDELPECWSVVDDKADSQLKKKYNEMKDNLRVIKQSIGETDAEMSKKQSCLSQGSCLPVDGCANYDGHYDGVFYEALNIFKPHNQYNMINNITEVDMNKGNLHFNKNLIDKKIFSPFIAKTKKEFHYYNNIPKGYVINEIQRLRNFSDHYSCCYILKSNQKKKMLMGFKKKGENKVYLYKYDKNIKKNYKVGGKNSPFFNISGFLGILICNFTGMNIKIYDNGIKEKYANFFPSFERKNIISISFESNIISELPRHFMCTIYKPNKDVKIIYENKCPVWNDDKEIYELPFYGRVKLASAKNLQLILKKCVVSNSLKGSFVGKTINDVIEYVSGDTFEGDSQLASTCAGRGKDGRPPHSPYEDGCSGEGDAKKHVLRKKFPFDVITNNFKKKEEEENFEIVNNDEEEIFLIFGKNSKDYFTLDFRHPLSSFEAFSIAISSLLKKKAVS
ncbi:hypothetical protein AK88_01803 [Plasmodium fragile]|uniref:Tubby C-terminal domain-containing protein n=1 Tax=Plasmodium fragile TaxID=5857 RepID=A0A0D9QN88_PLAFR|nr:uncharacterized protein AK88_01803 [Plasmodium fragile]KJP88524.1 hypothetical protein AK88_01803 [Plasmodium fragile]